MLIRCPQCQYANHVEADATKPRVVCARCATIISVEYLSNYTAPSVADVAEIEPTQPEPIFMKTPESPLDLDSLLNTPTDVITDQPVSPIPPPTPPPVSPVVPTQAFENAWDGEEILDIPRATPSAAPVNETPLGLEDLLAPPPQPESLLSTHTEYETRSFPVTPPPPPVTPETFPAAASGYASDVTGEAEESPLAEFFEQDSNRTETPTYSGQILEPVPAEEASPSAPKPSVFAQDSYVRSASNTYVMATPDRSNKGRLAKAFLAAALAFALLGFGYFALSGLVKDWLGLRKQQTAANQGAGTSGTTSTTGTPAASVAATVNDTTNKKPSPAASPSVSTSATPAATATASVKPSATPAATATPTPNQSAASKPTPTPAQAGTSGHAVGSGDGSLTVQVAAYKSSGEAQQTVARLKSAGVEARVIKADVPGKGTWFRVQSGRFTNESEASKYAGELRAKGVARDFIVTGYQNQ